MEFVQVKLTDCVHSRFNTRKTRDKAQIERLADRIRRNGFEQTRALWAVKPNGNYEVFAGGTRLEAARVAGLETVPVFVHAGVTEEQISRLADQDNENDEYHTPVSLLDVWAEYHRLNKDEGWTQQRIANAKGCDVPTVSRRVKWHTSLCEPARQAVCDNVFDEGHIESLSVVTCDIASIATWLTTRQAQTELVAEVLSKHRGSTAGIKPTVKVVREHAKRWKELIAAAEKAAGKLEVEGELWVKSFVVRLAEDKVRTVAAVDAIYGTISALIADNKQRRAQQLAIEAEQLGEEEAEAREEAARADRVAAFTSRVMHGDARELIDTVPAGFHLLLTDPPYGMDFQSQRRKATAKKDRIANDGEGEAFALIADVLAKAFLKMADDSTALVFTGWRHEPQVRQAVEAAGFTIKGSLVWVKKNHGTGDLEGSFAPKHERVIHAVKGNPKLYGTRPADVLDGEDKQDSEHPTEKPADLLAQLIEVTTDAGQTVVDPFAGSGGTLFEAHRLKRAYYGIELDEGWYRKVVDRVHELASEEVGRG